MQWNFEENRSDRGVMGTAFDIMLFFVAVVLLFVVAVLPVSQLASGAAPTEPVFWSSFYMSGPVGLLWFGVFLHRRRRAVQRSQLGAVPEELAAIYSFVNGSIVIFIGGWLLYSSLNAYFDRGEEQTHFAYVFDKQIADDGRYETYQLVLSDWNQDGSVVALDVTSDLYELVLEEQSCLRLTTQPGAFGHEWIVENKPFKWSDVLVEKDWKYQCQAAWEGQTQFVEGSPNSSEPWR